jgi:NitT/TauT family transport system permease protein
MSEDAGTKSILASVKARLSAEQALVLGILATLFVLAALVPDAPRERIADKSLYIGLIAGLVAIYIVGLAVAKDSYQKTSDIFLVMGMALLAWDVVIAKLAAMDPFLFPSPGKVFAVFGTDYDVMAAGIVSSLTILMAGYLLALAIAVPLALWVGWRKRAFAVAYPVAKAVSPIPPTTYLPYSIVLLPTFSSASVFVIFIGAFWPIFVSTVHGVFSIDRRIVNSARALGLRDRVMLGRVILPAALPSIFSGATIALIMSFITLTVAEMIAATSGLGWYIQYQHEFANYDKVVAGMILMGAVVIAMMQIFDRIQKYCLRWQSPRD